MELIKILGVAFVTSVTAILLRSTKPELSFAVTITGIIVILLFLIDALKGTIAIFASISQTTGMNNGLLKILLKIVGVGYITEFGAGVLNDFGSPSIADKVTLGGKIAIVVLSLPILESLLQLVRGFLNLV
ncbi:MAG: hypothetical protein E7355_00300 [Clostridiales bacterium]|nr:hypothetical protein [Clostridiales bacterium]